MTDKSKQRRENKKRNRREKDVNSITLKDGRHDNITLKGLLYDNITLKDGRHDSITLKGPRHDNITLIGMPASGKSTVGVLLAKRLGYSFVDVDIVIQERKRRLLKEIIADEGLDGFLEVENRINAGLDVRRSVIAPGGSVIYGREAMEHLRKIGTVVYLKLTYEDVERRLGDLVDRGVALKNGMTLKELYEERVAYYERYADITIDETGKDVGQVVDELRALMEERGKLL